MADPSFDVTISRKTLHQPGGDGFPMAIVEHPCYPGVRIVQLTEELILEQGSESITIHRELFPFLAQELTQAAMRLGGLQTASFSLNTATFIKLGVRL